MAQRSAAVVGATGLVGGFVVRRLLADQRWERVTTIGRRRLEVDNDRLSQVNGDLLDDGPWTEALAVDDVFCCLGTTIRRAGSQEAFRAVDHGAVLRVARAAVQAGARQFLLVSSLGANPGSRVFYNRVKGETERDVSALPLAGCQVFRPSLLLGPRQEFRLAERVFAVLAVPFGPLLGRYRPITAEAVGTAMAQVAAGAPTGVNVYESDRIAALAAGRPVAP